MPAPTRPATAGPHLPELASAQRAPDREVEVTSHRQALGAAGEQLAARWYRRNGYEIVARNWRCREGEIDLVCAKGRLLVVVEVKSRTDARFGLPAEAVTPQKQRRIRVITSRLLAELDVRPARVRFDVVSVLAGRVEVIHDAF